MVCRDFILPKPASYVFFYAFFNLRNLLYIIHSFTPFIVFGRKKTVTAGWQLRSYWSCCILVFTGLRTESGHTCPQAFTSALHLLRPDTALT